MITRKKDGITINSILEKVKKTEPKMQLSSIGVKNIINSEVFWSDFIPYFVDFMVKNPKTKDKRNKKES